MINDWQTNQTILASSFVISRSAQITEKWSFSRIIRLCSLPALQSKSEGGIERKRGGRRRKKTRIWRWLFVSAPDSGRAIIRINDGACASLCSQEQSVTLAQEVAVSWGTLTHTDTHIHLPKASKVRVTTGPPSPVYPFSQIRVFQKTPTV